MPFADTSLYKVPEELNDEQVLFVADILPTAYEVGVLNGRVEPGDTVAKVMELTGGLGADVAIEAVGLPDTFELCTELIRPGGRVANVGVHGTCVALHLEKLWIRDVMITTGIVDTRTTPMLLKLIEGGRLDPTVFATHHFPLADTEKAYDTFAAAAETGALKVVLHATPVARAPLGRREIEVAAR